MNKTLFDVKRPYEANVCLNSKPGYRWADIWRERRRRNVRRGRMSRGRAWERENQSRIFYPSLSVHLEQICLSKNVLFYRRRMLFLVHWRRAVFYAILTLSYRKTIKPLWVNCLKTKISWEPDLHNKIELQMNNLLERESSFPLTTWLQKRSTFSTYQYFLFLVKQGKTSSQNICGEINDLRNILCSMRCSLCSG